MTHVKLSPFLGLLAGLALTALSSHTASAQLLVTWTPSVILGGSTGTPFLTTSPGNFVVTVRLPTGAPAPGALVELDFSIAGTTRLIDTQNPGTTVLCPPRTLSQVTNAAGQAIFDPRFSGWVNGPQVLLRVNGVNETTLEARSTAMSVTSPATALAAFNLFSARYGGFFPEADFDVSGGLVGLGDFSIFSAEYIRAQPPQGLCP
jgi:hypothetical protein